MRRLQSRRAALAFWDMARAVLTLQEMYAADRAAMAAGIPGEALMEAAGCAVAREIRRRWRRCRVAVLCGPGNNGGDGFVIARHLRRRGWPVKLALLGERARLKGDAALNAERWQGPVHAAEPGVLEGCDLVVDALFGAGLARPVEGAAAALVEAIGARGLACVAVDVPSGVHGDSGEILGCAPRAALTVTFFRRKPGHLLLPGRLHCGEVVLADIGIPERVLADIQPRLFENTPGLWREALPRPRATDHKYRRGHALIVSGPMTGAARLAARGARRIGAGLVTALAAPEALAVIAADRPGTIVVPLEDYDSLLADARRNAVLLGPGAGVGEATRARVLAALAAGKRVVLDADAVTSFGERREELFRAIAGRDCVLTPHDGEFARLFAAEGDRVTRARRAAAESGGVVVLKGSDTVIAAPDGRCAINANAPPDLATAGSGDVLAGMVLGLLAQGVPAFEAACAAVWLHGAAASHIGRGLIAEDIPEALPRVLAALDLNESQAGGL